MDLIVARTLHVLSVVFWIGGVGFVTTTMFPAIRRLHEPQARLSAFVRFEGRFAPQARVWVAIAGLSGLYMIVRMDLWSRFASPHFWWVHAMVGLWLIFAVMLFILEPLVLHARMKAAMDTPEAARIFMRMERGHQVLFVLAVVTVLGAMAGSHGL